MQEKKLIAKNKDSFSGIEAAQIAGLPYRTVDYWATTGFVVPSISDAEGRGTERKYAFDDLVALRIARDLRKKGISLQALRSIVAELRRRMPLQRNPLAESRLVKVGSDVQLMNNTQSAMSVFSSPGQGTFAFTFDLDGTKLEIRKNIKKVRAA
jgi:DNA-binding transcriptional MerR regulator